MSVRQLVADATTRLADAGVASPQRDAQLLLAHAWGVDAGEIARFDILGTPVPPAVQEKFDSLIDARAERIPLQHLTGRAYFRHLELAVGPGVFIPRPETEMLVDAVLAAAPPDGVVVDLCSGSGAIALAIKQERPDLTVHAVELDENALAWAARNIAQLGLDVALHHGRAQDALPEMDGRVDVVVSNPPYVPVGMVPRDIEVAQHDPQLALYGGSEDGLLFPLQIAERASALLKPGGMLFMEHAETQGESLPAALLNKRGFDRAHDERDATDRPRMTVARREGGARFETVTDPTQRPRRSRETVRLIILDQDNCVLLYEDSDQGLTPAFTWWSTPGGGIDPGESERQAAVRELWEETGAQATQAEFLGPIATRRVVHGYSDQIISQRDAFYVLRRDRFEVKPGALTPEEQVTMQRWRWWPLAELSSTTERVWPAQLGELIAAFARQEPTHLSDAEESSVAAT